MVALTIWTFRATPKHHRARKAAIWTLILLVVEALLGAALVLRHWVESNDSIGRVIAQGVHFTNTLLLMAALTLTAYFLRNQPTPAEHTPSGRRAAWMAFAATIVIGATGALAALADTLFPSASLQTGLAEDLSAHAPILQRMRVLHPIAAIAGLFVVLWMIRTAGPKTRAARAVAALLALQFVLGIADVLLLAPTWMQVLHLLGADLFWVALILLAAQILWPRHAASPAA
jgi:cytochrome c oxidase assembly protein subunit 15